MPCISAVAGSDAAPYQVWYNHHHCCHHHRVVPVGAVIMEDNMVVVESCGGTVYCEGRLVRLRRCVDGRDHQHSHHSWNRSSCTDSSVSLSIISFSIVNTEYVYIVSWCMKMNTNLPVLSKPASRVFLSDGGGLLFVWCKSHLPSTSE